MLAPLEHLCPWQTLLREPAVDRRRSDGHPALLHAFFALASAAKRGDVPPDAGEEPVLLTVGTRAPAHHRSSICNIRWAERQSRPHDGLCMHMGDTSLRSGGLRSNTSQTFFVATVLQFSLRDGNVYYDVICGT